MYGLILLNVKEYIVLTFGEDKWKEFERLGDFNESHFEARQVYPESYLAKISDSVNTVLDKCENEFFEEVGRHFIHFLSHYGYDCVLASVGRNFRDFLNGLDDLHEYMKISYSHLRAPSFACENETSRGLTLHYRSKRRLLVHYMIGIIKEVAKFVYNKEIIVLNLREENFGEDVHVTLQLCFDNEEYRVSTDLIVTRQRHLPISSDMLFEIFPFSIVFGSDMIVRHLGNSLHQLAPFAIGATFSESFIIVRPIGFWTFSQILDRTNAVFEIVMTLTPKPNPNQSPFTLKGQMVHLRKWKMIVFLGTPVMPNLDFLMSIGLYLNDLSMHDFSRDSVLAGTQQSVELKLALDQEQEKTAKIKESIFRLDDEMEKTNRLLYQMIPEHVANRLRNGESPVDTCQMYENVSILLSDVVKFTEMCSRLTPMEVVGLLNRMYSIFDDLTNGIGVCKVETIGDAYMVVSGTQKEEDHVKRICLMGLTMLDRIQTLTDPSTGTHVRIRLGIHTGPIVAGIVGVKMPRYCLFGKTVQLTSIMEATSEPMKIQISESTKLLLPDEYTASYKGTITTRYCQMKTYWLQSNDVNITPNHNFDFARQKSDPEPMEKRFGFRLKCDLL